MIRTRLTVLVLALASAGCTCGTTAPEGDGGRDGGGFQDGGGDGGATRDGGVDDGGGTDAGPSPDSGPGADAGPNAGDCNNNSDCPGGTCVALSPGGFRTCQFPVMPATSCQSLGADQCCNTSQCDAGTCLTTPIVPMCSGVLMQPHNVCASNQCDPAAPCPAGSLCVPAGALGFQIQACLTTACLLDTDCTAHPGGKCESVTDHCCSAVIGLYCVYPNGGCRTGQDCGLNAHCAIDGGAAWCVNGFGICPG